MYNQMFRFKVDIFNEISWQKFQQLPDIKGLPLTEQVKKYNLYIDELTFERNTYLHWLEGHKKGARTVSEDSGETFFLLQEDDNFLLQEDGSKLIWN